MIKKVLKKIIPPRIQQKLGQAKMFRIGNNFKNMTNAYVFDKIYNKGTWGKNIDGISTSGIGSHTKEIIHPYITQISNFLLEKKPSIIVDLGCGDFNIGSNFVSFTDKYIACDVSNVILSRNRDKFSSLTNVEFKLLDLSKDYLPKGDICFVRQVLQHLSNADIKTFVENLNSNKPYKYLVVTEHLPNSDDFDANLDIETGPDIRLIVDSGVVLHKAPFNLDVSNISELLEVVEGIEGGGRVKTTMYEF
ncbi:hypothetical protein COTS27_00975 [Spirochaetota bacterium]|nr:hypothetical protein COTS27_00975 [Spirochaetota bacterium]